MSLLLELLAEKGSVNLELYGHQVGGHLLILKFGDVICKPLVPREHFFYQSISREVKLFTPAYHGVISVGFERGPQGELQPVARPSTSAAVPCPPPPVAGDFPLPIVMRSGVTRQERRDDDPPHVSKVTGAECQLPIPIMATAKMFLHNVNLHNALLIVPPIVGDAYMNPWSCEFLEGTLQKLQNVAGDQQRQEFVVLENLTTRFNCPCILDLKIGTRQYGDDSSEEKKKKHMQTCAMSTSSTLGVRFCGLQKYNAATEEYVFHDKYYGRRLNKDGFVEELKQFLHNGVIFRSELLHPLIVMLKSLREVVLAQDSYRFYSSSLLIIYDGKPRTPAHVNGCSEPVAAAAIGTKSLQTHLQSSREMVDVRMIDFAHATHRGYLNDPIQYTGTDDGYVVGLNTIIATFEGMLGE